MEQLRPVGCTEGGHTERRRRDEQLAIWASANAHINNTVPEGPASRSRFGGVTNSWHEFGGAMQRARPVRGARQAPSTRPHPTSISVVGPKNTFLVVVMHLQSF